MRLIYLDYNATTPVAPAVVDAMLPFFGEHYGNPSSSHALGRAAAEAIETAREQVASLIGADSDEIVFTAGGTESNNLALLGTLTRRPPPAHLIVSALEHPAVVRPADHLRGLGYRVTTVPCDSQGVVDPEAVADAFEDDTAVVSVMHASNEIGAVQPLLQMAELCRSRGILLHTDAAQSVGKIRAQAAELDVDLLTIAGHKLYAPKGVGALYVRRGVDLRPVLHGADHESGLRPGTENTPYIVGLGAAALLARSELEIGEDVVARQRDRLEAALVSGIPGLTVHSRRAPRLPNTLSASFPRVAGADLLGAVPEICASTGAACHSGEAAMSATMKALGVSPAAAAGAVRLSLGRNTTDEEVDRAAELLIDAWQRLT